jgi:putative DNA primase/helicase
LAWSLLSTRNLFEYVPEFKLWLGTNELPTISGNNEAIWRRIMVVDFPITIPPEQQDKRLAGRLFSELPGILEWAMQGCIEWRKIGLAPPAGVLESTQAYRKDNDSIGQWIESTCSLDATLRTSMKDFYMTPIVSGATAAVSNHCTPPNLSKH